MQAVGILVWVWSVVGRSVGPLSKRRLLNFSEIVRRMSDFFAPLKYVADSLYLCAVKPK